MKLLYTVLLAVSLLVPGWAQAGAVRYPDGVSYTGKDAVWSSYGTQFVCDLYQATGKGSPSVVLVLPSGSPFISPLGTPDQPAWLWMYHNGSNKFSGFYTTLGTILRQGATAAIITSVIRRSYPMDGDTLLPVQQVLKTIVGLSPNQLPQGFCAHVFN
jgi:hypothetical protein